MVAGARDAAGAVHDVRRRIARCAPAVRVLAGLERLPAAGVLPPGTYLWFIVIDADTNGTMNTTFFDYVITVISP